MRAATVLTVLALAATAFAGGNPDAMMFIDFDPPNRVHAIEAEQYSTCEAYVCIGNIGEGVLSVAFALNDLTVEYPYVFAPPPFTSLFWYP